MALRAYLRWTLLKPISGLPISGRRSQPGHFTGRNFRWLCPHAHDRWKSIQLSHNRWRHLRSSINLSASYQGEKQKMPTFESLFSSARHWVKDRTQYLSNCRHFGKPRSLITLPQNINKLSGIYRKKIFHSYKRSIVNPTILVFKQT